MEYSVSESAKKPTITKLVAGVLIGVIICGIPLAVMTSLYVNEKSSSSNSVTTTIASTSSNLPSQCTTYTSNADSTRNIGYIGCTDCQCDNSLTSGWYRFLGGAGTKLTTSTTSTYMCGARYTGWFNGTFPSVSGGTSYGSVCVNVDGNLCHTSYSISSVSVTNCNDFYVFYLTSMANCNTRYCTT